MVNGVNGMYTEIKDETKSDESIINICWRICVLEILQAITFVHNLRPF